MKLLFDTNIVLDVLLYRQPWVQDAQALWKANDQGIAVGYLTATTLTDIFYVARRIKNLGDAHKAIGVCLNAFEICPVTRQTLELAHSLKGNDFEDNLQIACTQLVGLDGIVTRNPSDFESSSIPVFTTAKALSQLES